MKLRRNDKLPPGSLAAAIAIGIGCQYATGRANFDAIVILLAVIALVWTYLWTREEDDVPRHADGQEILPLPPLENGRGGNGGNGGDATGRQHPGQSFAFRLGQSLNRVLHRLHLRRVAS